MDITSRVDIALGSRIRRGAQRSRSQRLVFKQFGRLVCLCNGKVSHQPLSDVWGKLHHVDPDTEYDRERYNGRRTFFNTGKKFARGRKELG